MAECLVCGGTMPSRWRVRDHSRPETESEYGVLWCQDCAYGRVEGVFTPEEISAFYMHAYYTHMAPDARRERPEGFLSRMRMHLAWRMDRGVDLSPGEAQPVSASPRLCDVGCGNGNAMRQFRAAGYEVTGIEPDPAARAIAAGFGQVYDGTAESLPREVAGQSFDVVLLSHVLEHCIDPVRALRNVRGLLAPGGRAIVEVPNNATQALECFGPAWFFADIPRHLHFFTEPSLRQVMKRAGLRAVRTFHTGYTRQFSPSWLAAQQTIAERIGRSGTGEASQWRLLARTVIADPGRKYDSIRLHATAAE